MGKTVRREPIINKIPTVSDYEFLNITDFKGLDINDNPFITLSTSASDILNVYVNENNSLTTRPRIEKTLTLSDYVLDFEKLLYHYPLDSCDIYQIQTSTGVKLFKNQNSQITELKHSNANFTFSEQKQCIFQHKNTIYINNENGYFIINNNVLEYILNSTHSYIPQHQIGSFVNDTVTLVESEPLNILNNKYYIDFFWDGFSSLDKFRTYGEIVHNKYNVTINSDLISYKNNFGLNTGVFLDNGDAMLKSDDSIKRINITNNKISFAETINVNEDILALSASGEWLVSSTDNTILNIRNTLTNDVFVVDLGDYYLPDNARYTTKLIITDTGNHIFGVAHRDATNYDIVRISKNNETYITETMYQSVSTDFLSSSTEISINDSNTYLTIYSGGIQLKIFSNLYADTIKDNVGVINMEVDPYTYKMCINNEGSEIYGVNDNILKIWSVSDNKKVQEVYFKEGNIDDLTVSYYSGRLGLRIKDTLYIYTNETNEYYDVLTKLNDKETEEYPYTTVSYFKLDKTLTNLSTITTFKKDSISVGDYDLLQVQIHKIQASSEPGLRVLVDNIEDDKLTIHTEEVAVDVNEKSYVIDCSGHYKTQWFTINFNDYTFPIDTEEDGTNRIGGNDYYINVEVFNRKVTITKANYSLDFPWLIGVNYKYTIFKDPFIGFTEYTNFQDNIWFYGKDNIIRWSTNNNPTYLTEFDYNEISSGHVKKLSLFDYSTLLIFTDSKVYTTQPVTINETSTYSFVENALSSILISANGVVRSSYSDTLYYMSKEGVFKITQLYNVQSNEKTGTLISTKINSKLLKDINDNIITHDHLYWSYYIIPNIISKIYVLDNRTQEWYYWEIPTKIVSIWEIDSITHIINDDGVEYILSDTDIINEYNNDLMEYYDDGKQVIEWRWVSQILHLGSINYSKKLINTTFIVSDSDATDEYALNYSFKTYRKTVSESDATTIYGTLNYVQSITKKTSLSRFNFIQLKLTNVEETLTNNKLRLIGLGFKYNLLERLL